jgi:Ca2+-binding EF-hand superfamily protein
MKKSVLILIMSVLSSLVFSASADISMAPTKTHQGMKGQGHGMKSVIEYADINGDGDITFEEFQRTKYQYFNYKFRQLDENRDGVVTEREFMEFHRTKGDELFSKMDLDGDGVITQSERAQAKGGMHGKHEGCMHQSQKQE